MNGLGKELFVLALDLDVDHVSHARERCQTGYRIKSFGAHDFDSRRLLEDVTPKNVPSRFGSETDQSHTRLKSCAGEVEFPTEVNADRASNRVPYDT